MGRGLSGVIAVLTALAGLLAACQGSSILKIPQPGTADQAAWAMVGGTALRQGRTALSGPAAGGEARWQFSLDGDIEYPPALAEDGTIYLAQGEVLSAFSPDGEELWRADAGSRIVAPPRITDDGLVQLVTFGGDYPDFWPGMTFGHPLVQFYDTGAAEVFVDSAGLEQRRIELTGRHPLLAEGAEDGGLFLIDFGYADFELVGIDAEGTELWSQPLGSTEKCSRMALSGAYIYFVQDFKFRIFDDSGHEYQWDSELSYSTDNHIAPASNGHVYLVASITSGEETRSAITSISPFGYDYWNVLFVPPTIEPGMLVGPDDMLYASDHDQTLYAVDGGGGFHWDYPDAGYVIGISPDGEIYALTHDYLADTSTLNVFTPDGQLVSSQPGFPELDSEATGTPDYLPQQWLAFRDDGSYLFFGQLDQGDRSYAFGLHAVDAAGNILWSRQTADSYSFGPLADAQGNVYACNSRVLFALNQAGGLRWSRELVDSTSTPPVLLSDGSILTFTGTHLATAFAPDGEIAWQTDLNGWGFEGLMAANGSGLYIPGRYTLYCLDQAGNQVYFYNAEADIHGGPAAGPDGTAYFFDLNDRCYAVDRAGQESWRFTTEDSAGWDYPVMMDDGAILFPARGGLVAVDARGTELWSYAVEGPDVSSSTPALSADGVIYLPVSGYFTVDQEQAENRLYALRPPEDVLWTAQLDRFTALQPLVDAAGNIYVYSSIYEDGITVISSAGEILGSLDGGGSTYYHYTGGLCIAPGRGLLVASPVSVSTYGP